MTLDALLNELERLQAAMAEPLTAPMPVEQKLEAWAAQYAATRHAAELTPLLARMLREAVGALYAGANLVNGRAECRAALSRLDAMAGEIEV